MLRARDKICLGARTNTLRSSRAATLNDSGCNRVPTIPDSAVATRLSGYVPGQDLEHGIKPPAPK